MEVYVVGGAVRDVLLGSIPKDVDYVVVGSSHDEMISLGFNRVGSGFPVYLHPISGDEYALARQERKVSAGYNGFECNVNNVSLYDDLSRRDLTINAMAVSICDWESFISTRCPSLVIDHFGGKYDLGKRIIRNINENFALDPIRVLRAARFAARYDFDIHHTTIQLMKEIVHEINDVPSERIWLEFEKGLMENSPENMIMALNDCGAFDINALFPFRRCNLPIIPTDMEVSLAVRFTLCATNFFQKDYAAMCIPNHISNISNAFNITNVLLANYGDISPVEKLDIFTRCKSIHTNDILDEVLLAFRITNPVSWDAYIDQIIHDICTLRSVDYETVAKTAKSNNIKQAIQAAKIAALT